MAAANRRTARDLKQLGEHIRNWRKVLGLSAQVVSEQAGIARSTLYLLENGSGGVSAENLLAVLRVLGVNGILLQAVDPLESDVGRARAKELIAGASKGKR